MKVNEFKNCKASKTVKNPNNLNKKCFTCRHLKNTLNILKPITHSRLFSQVAETVLKPKVFDLDLVTIEQPKTATKLSNAIKLSNFVTYPSKIKVYEESKKSDCTLQLILLKNIIFLKDIPDIILNSKKYHGQLDVIRSSIKNNLFEISKELLEFKFKQKLRKEFTKIDGVFKNKIFALTHGLKKNRI